MYDVIKVYTDGSSYQNPRIGGIGIRIIQTDRYGNDNIKDIELPGYIGSTNNQMELLACQKALETIRKEYNLKKITRIVVFTDSMYIVDNYKKAMFEWCNTHWRLRSGKPVLNTELWKAIVKEIKKVRRRVEFQWVKGHAKNEHSRAVDKLAKISARTARNKPLTIVDVRRKRSNLSVEVGCVKMNGQRLTIRIITTEFLNTQKTWKCKYEVISRNSEYKDCIDIIFSDTLLRAGHVYYVKVNDNTNNQTVKKIYREIIQDRVRGQALTEDNLP